MQNFAFKCGYMQFSYENSLKITCDELCKQKAILPQLWWKRNVNQVSTETKFIHIQCRQSSRLQMHAYSAKYTQSQFIVYVYFFLSRSSYTYKFPDRDRRFKRCEWSKKERMKNRHWCFWPGRTINCIQILFALLWLKLQKKVLLLHNLCAFIFLQSGPFRNHLSTTFQIRINFLPLNK